MAKDNSHAGDPTCTEGVSGWPVASPANISQAEASHKKSCQGTVFPRRTPHELLP